MLRKINFVVLVLLTLAVASPAFEGRDKKLSLDAKALSFPRLEPNYDQTRVNLYLQDPAWTSWNAAHGGNWTAQFDTLTGKPRRVYGGAIPWIGLDASSADLERVARAFIDANQSLLAAPNSRLQYVPDADSSRDRRIRYAAFDYVVDGVRAESARLVFAVNNGNMIYWSSTNIASVPVLTTPSLSADSAVTALVAYLGVSSDQVSVNGAPRLELLPRNTSAGGLLTYQLVYAVSLAARSDYGTWVGHVDASNGTVVAFGDMNRYLDACPTAASGDVKGGIRPAEATDAEVVRSFPFVRVDSKEGALGSSFNGAFGFGGGSTSSSLGGTFFDVTCIDCVKSKQEPVEGWQPFVSSAFGRLDFGTGGGDEITATKTVSYGNGTSTPADRTAFFHTNVARSMALKWLDLSWLQSNMGVNVNINDECNAFWNGVSTNFFKKGKSGTLTCNNTGEIRDVMQHEWGHGIDSNDGQRPGLVAGLGDFATGESVGDHVALFVDHDTCIGQSFATPRNMGPFITDPDTMGIRSCNGVRNIDEHRATIGQLTTTNVTQKCAIATVNVVLALAPYYIGPLLSQGHCESQIWSQAAWHLQNNLMTGRKYGTVKLDANKQFATYEGDPIGSGADGSANPAIDRDLAWTIHERLFYASRPIVATYAPSHMQAIGTSAYDAYLVVDDEGDGLSNGTPHAAYINDAFVHHGIEELGPPGGRPSGIDAKNCDQLAAPSVSASQSVDSASGSPAVTISWNSVAGAASYTVLRTERRNDVFLEIARVDASQLSVSDAGVDNGVSYLYRVQANGGSGCYSASPAGLVSVNVAQPDAQFRSAMITDSPQGNGDGGLDAGEKASLYIVVANEGLAGLTNVSASLRSATSGVSVTKAGPYSYGSIAAGGTAGPAKQFQIAIDNNALLCGTHADLILTVTSDQGCFVRAVQIPIGNDGTSCVVFRDTNVQPTSVGVTRDNGDATCGDGDLVPDPGETIEVTVTVNNTGTKTAHNVTVSLAVDKPYFTFAGPSSIDVGSLAGSGLETKSAVFTLTVGDAPFNDTATFTARAGENSLSTSTAVNRDKALSSFAYGFETGNDGWTATGAAVGWVRQMAPQTGNLTTVFYSQYEPSSCPLLVSPRFEISSTSEMAFDFAYVSENSDAAWDGVDIQISIDGGTSWQKLVPDGGYSAFPTSDNAGSGCIPSDEPLFSGYSPLMQRYRIDLSNWAGYTAQVRFRWSADPLVEAPIVGGSWVDNVSMKNVIVPAPSAPCP